MTDDSITVELPHDIEILDSGVVPIQNFIDILLIAVASPFSQLTYNDIRNIRKIENDSGRLSILVNRPLNDYATKAVVNAWNLLEADCEVKITIDD